MGNCGSCGPVNCNSYGSVRIIQGYAKQHFVNLFYDEILQPYNLTGCLQIEIAYPGISGSPVIETLTSSAVVILGSPGAGYLQVNIPATDSLNMQVNPYEQQFQDLQVVVTNADGSNTAFLLQGVLDIALPSYGVIA